MPLEYYNPANQDKTYDVEKSVGLNSVNQNGDVKLVQYMLQRIYSKGFATPPAKPLVVDGWIGPITVEWIKRFQMDINAKGHLYAQTQEYRDPAKVKCVVDGRVDAILNGSGLGSVSDLPYTIGWLNNVQRKIDPQGYASIPAVVPCKRCAYYQRPNPYNDPKPSTVPTVAGGF